MDKSLEVKRKHHHVWADYLSRWSADGRDIYCSTKNRKIEQASVRGLAMEKDFYKLTKLSTQDIELIRIGSKNSPPELHRIHLSYLQDFMQFQWARNVYEVSGKFDSEVEAHLRAAEHNLLENLHSAHERGASKILDHLAAGKLSVLKSEEAMMDFMIFLGHQITRTKAFKRKAIGALSRTSKDAQVVADSMAHAWWFYSYMFGMNIGKSFYECQKINRHSLLINRSPSAFITSDQPIINIHPSLDLLAPGEAPTKSDFYYPISPNSAYLICDSQTFPAGVVEVDEQTVADLNIKIAKKADVHIFGNSSEIIAPLIKHIPKLQEQLKL